MFNVALDGLPNNLHWLDSPSSNPSVTPVTPALAATNDEDGTPSLSNGPLFNDPPSNAVGNRTLTWYENQLGSDDHEIIQYALTAARAEDFLMLFKSLDQASVDELLADALDVHWLKKENSTGFSESLGHSTKLKSK
jgi:hypothetical protein